MTEEQWLTCDEPRTMLGYLGNKVSDRRSRLLACACVRRVWDALTDSRSREWVESTERFVDGLFDRERFETVTAGTAEIRSPLVGHFYAQERPGAPPYVVIGSQITSDTIVCIAESLKIFNEITADYTGVIVETPMKDKEFIEYNTVLFRVVPTAPLEVWRERENGHIAIVRDLFGNPFRRLFLDPAWSRWQDSTIIKLTQAAYENRFLPTGILDNTRLGILADALEEAGCTDEQILTHLRSGGEHYRGCFVVDALLGKS